MSWPTDDGRHASAASPVSSLDAITTTMNHTIGGPDAAAGSPAAIELRGLVKRFGEGLRRPIGHGACMRA
jgi:hypothetical protein